MSDLARTLASWIDVESITGNEGDFGDLIAETLRRRGFDVELQEVEPGRRNVLARAERPEVVFCTHLDTVPPFIAPRIEGGTIWGRGACDAKGQALSMLMAAEQLIAAGERRVGFLLTVGEEIDSAGAQFADHARRDNPARRDEWSPRYTFVGEPTDGRFISGHKGLFFADLVARGVAGHSSNPLGPSAVHELVGCCSKLVDADWGHDDTVGQGTVNVGTITGGVAPNVVAADARASVLVRAVEEPDVVRARIESHLGPHVSLEEGREQYGPVKFFVPDGHDASPVAFGTDAPHLSGWGELLLCGPGSIDLAHTDDERIEASEIEEGAAQHVRTALALLSRDAS